MITITSNGKFPGDKLKRDERFAKLYHYTSFDTFVKIWLTKQLKFGIISTVNDIQETTKGISCDLIQQTALICAYQDIRISYKQISLTMDYDSYYKGCMSPMMWGHYADKRKGVCIELDYNKLCFSRNTIKGIVNYKKLLNKSTKIPPEAKTGKCIKTFIQKNAKEIFFTKQSSWRGENEFRIVSSDSDYLDISNAISTIYLTSNDSQECLLTEKLVDGIIPVKHIHYIESRFKAIPVITDTKSSREQMENAKKSEDNALMIIYQQAKEKYDSLKHDENASLLIDTYNCNR